MPNETTPIPSLGQYRKRQQAAKERAEERIAPPDVRAIRRAVLERREAAMQEGREEAKEKATRPGELYRESLALVPDGLLEELERSLPNLCNRQMADVISEVLRARRRARHAADFAVVPEAPEKPAKAG